jgi:hypothetical protein
MGLLDRLKPQPRWKHADPVVRIAGVQELPEDNQDLLLTIARDDPDARVRRIAVSKLGSVAALSERIARDTDTQVREEAAGVLLDIALGAYEADEVASLAAVDGLQGLPASEAQKQLVLIAKSARLESVARRALDLAGEDGRVLGTVARRSEHATIRLEALRRLNDPQEIGATALKSDYKDVALAAVERTEDPETLRAVAARAKSPAAQRRARSLVRAIDEREAEARAAETRRLALQEARRQAQRDLCRSVEALVPPMNEGQGFTPAGGWQMVERRLSEAEARWQSFGTDVDADVARRFGEACAAARDALGRHQQEIAARERQEQERADLLRRLEEICARIERLPADQVAANLDSLKAEWEAAAAPALAPSAAAGPRQGSARERVFDRFDGACRAAEERAHAAEAIAADIERLSALSRELEALSEGSPFDAHPAEPASAPPDADAAAAPHAEAGDASSNAEAAKPDRGRRVRARWKALREQWRMVPDLARTDPRAADALARWSAAEARLQAREQEARDARVREARDVTVRADRAAEALERLAERDDATLRGIELALRAARAAAGALDGLEPSPDRARARERLDRAQTAIGARLHALREADDWQRWANAGVQEQLAARMEALREATDPAEALRGLRELQLEWRKVALGPRDGGQGLWKRFLTARDQVRARTEAYVANLARERAENLARKQALCEKAEALASSTDWIRTAETIKGLQAEWKGIGAGPRRGEQVLWERFRAACDQFFSRRHEDLAQRKKAWAANLVRKEELCARAEALADSDDWDATAVEFKRLQAEWKTIGPVRRSRSEILWRRFHEACDRFFERYKHRHDTDRAARVNDRESIVREIEALAAADGEGPGSTDKEGAESASGPDRLTSIRGLRARWNAAPALPHDLIAPLKERVESALVTFAQRNPDVVRGSELDVEANTHRLEALCARAEQLAGSDADTASASTSSPAAILASQLREALAANTIGGRGDVESRRRAVEQEARQLQMAWDAVGFVPESRARPLADRFRRALRRSVDQTERRGSLAGRAG